MGENPAMSDPDVQHAREALAKLDHLVVQEIFLTETARHADVILPATAFPEKTGTFTNTDRRVQLGRAAPRPAGRRPPGLVDLAANWAAGSGSTGITSIPARSTRNSAAACPRSGGSPGSGSNAKGR